MSEWETYMNHGDEFYTAAKGGYQIPEKFNEDALFNLTAMAIEKLSMALLLKNHKLPEGHSFCDLVAGLKRVAPLPAGLDEDISGLDVFQSNFCSLEAFKPDLISREDIPPMLRTCERLKSYVMENIGA